MHVETQGQGRDLLLIHGWGMHAGIWDGVAQALAPHCRVQAVDLPGMGLSPPCTPYTAERLTAMLAELLAPASIVCGWSLGGQLAMRLALDYPERVARLVLVGTTPRFVRGPDWKRGMDAQVFREFAQQVADDYQATLARFLALQAFGGTGSRELLRQLRERFAARPAPDRAALGAALQLLLTSDLRAQVPGIAQPTLVVHGERDTLAPVTAACWLAESLPDARLCVLQGASHAPFLSHPAAFLQAVTEFLE